MHEFYEQKKEGRNIDVLFSGASHVSHGIDTTVSDAVFGKNTFCTGSAGQNIEGSYAIIQQALKLYDVEKIFVELDFAIATRPPVKDRSGFKPDYSLLKSIRDPRIKLDYMLSMSSPRYYLNSILPIGKDKHMTLNPKDLKFRLKSFFNGDYWSYNYVDKDADYAGKGSLLDIRVVENGTFSSPVVEGPIHVENVNSDWVRTIDKIIEDCRQKNVELIFYNMPNSDFYLNEKGNYDEYYSFCRDFCSERGFEFYDFNLAKEEYLPLEDCDFHDDNHFNKYGVKKWTEIFCSFFLDKYDRSDFFYSSYAEKMQAQEDKIYGLVLLEKDDGRAMDVVPVVNHVEPERITYDVFLDLGDGEEPFMKNASGGSFQFCALSSDNEYGSDRNCFEIRFPGNSSGKIRVISYLDGVQQNVCSGRFASY